MRSAARWHCGRKARDLARLKWLVAAVRFELALTRHDRAIKAGFDPNQPRVPRGNPDGGQWTEAPGWRSQKPAEVNDQPKPPEDVSIGNLPEVPKERPRTGRERNAIVRALARRFGPYVWIAVEAGSWVYDHKEEINAYFDPPRSLEELQEAANRPEKGYDIHHIVERHTNDGTERSRIESPDNLVRIPRWKHWQINSYYMTRNKDFGWLTPRQYLKDKSWEIRRQVGLKALERAGVLKR